VRATSEFQSGSARRSPWRPGLKAWPSQGVRCSGASPSELEFPFDFRLDHKPLKMHASSH